MIYGEQQKNEIATIRARKIELLLSDADIQRLWEKAGKVGMTAGELLSSFVGDLVCGTYTNGSDERMYANDWFERCGFSFMAEKTFLRYLLEYGELEYIITGYTDIIECKEALSELEAQTDKDTDDLEEIESIKKDVSYWQKNIDQTFNAFVEWCKGECKGFDEEIKKVLEWHKNMKGDI